MKCLNKNKKILMELQIGGTHEGSSTQADILAYGLMGYII